MIVFMCLCSLETAWPIFFWGVLLLLLVGALSFRVEPWPSPKYEPYMEHMGDIWPSKNAKFLADCTVRIQWHYGELLEKWLGPVRSSASESNPDKSRKCFVSACCIPIVNKITYCEAVWKNSSRWTNKTWSESFSNEHRIPDCFKMFSQHVGGRSIADQHGVMTSWDCLMESPKGNISSDWMTKEAGKNAKLQIVQQLIISINLAHLHDYVELSDYVSTLTLSFST